MSWYNPVTWYLDEANTKAAADAQAKNAAFTADYVARHANDQGFDATQYQADVVKNTASEQQTTGVDYSSQDAAVNSSEAAVTKEFQNTISTNLKDGLNVVGGGLWATLRTVLAGIPWWLFVITGAAIFLYFGGLPWLRRQFKK